MAVTAGKEVGRVSIRVLPNSAKFREDLKKILNRVEATMAANIRVNADTRPAMRQLDNWVKSVNRHVEADVKIGADTAPATAQIARVARNRVVDLKINVNKAALTKAAGAIAALSGGRAVGTMFADIGRGLANLDKNLPKIALVATSIASLVSGLLSAIGGLAGIGSSLGSLIALAAPVPGLLAAAGVAGFTLVVALAAAKTQLASLQPAWESLKTTIQDNFWARAQQPILDLVNDVFPQLQDGLSAVSNSLGAWAASVAGSFQQAFSGGVLSEMMGLLATSIDNSTVGTDAFASSIAALGLFAAQYLPSIGTWFSDISLQFNGFIQTVTGNGQLTQWVTDALGVLSTLGSTLVNIIWILDGIDNAATAAGGGGLEAFARAIGSATELITGADFQRALTTLFQGANAGFSALGSALGPIGRMIETLAPTISSVLTLAGEALGGLLTNIASALQEPAFQEGLASFFAGIKTGLDAIGPALPAVAAALGALGGVAGDLAAQLGPVLGAALSAAAPLLTEILNQVSPLIPILGDALIQAIQALAPALMTIVTEVFPPLVDAISSLAPLLPGLVSFFAELLVQTAPIAGQLLETLLPAFVQLTPAILALLEALTPLLQYLPILTQQIQLVASIISTVLVVAFGIMQVIWTAFTALITGDWSNFAQTVTDIAVGMGNSITGIWQTWVGGIVDIFNNGADQATQIGTDLGHNIRNLFTGAGEWLVDSGRAIIQGLIDGIMGMIGAARDAIGGVMDAVAAFLPHSPAKEGPFSGKGWTLYSGQALVAGLADGISAPASVSRVRSAASGTLSAFQLGASGGVSVTRSGSASAVFSLDGAPLQLWIEGKPFTGIVQTELTRRDRTQTLQQIGGSRG